MTWQQRPYPGLSCRDFVELVSDYLDQVLPIDVAERMDTHLSGCPGCLAYLEQMRRTLDLLATLREPAPPETCLQLLDMFREWAAAH
jgi:predicted anti-sigma-YlaC factor YlaD